MTLQELLPFDRITEMQCWCYVPLWALMGAPGGIGLITSSPRRGRGGSSEISPPLFRAIQKPLFPTCLTSIFLSTAYFAISLLQTLSPFFQSLHYSFVPFIGVKLLVWTIYSLLCRVVFCILCWYAVS